MPEGKGDLVTLTIDLPRTAEVRLDEESKRTSVPVHVLAARMLLEHMKLNEPAVVRRAPRPGFASDLFQGIDVDA